MVISEPVYTNASIYIYIYLTFLSFEGFYLMTRNTGSGTSISIKDTLFTPSGHGTIKVEHRSDLRVKDEEGIGWLSNQQERRGHCELQKASRLGCFVAESQAPCGTWCSPWCWYPCSWRGIGSCFGVANGVGRPCFNMMLHSATSFSFANIIVSRWVH